MKKGIIFLILILTLLICGITLYSKRENSKLYGISIKYDEVITFSFNKRGEVKHAVKEDGGVLSDNYVDMALGDAVNKYLSETLLEVNEDKNTIMLISHYDKTLLKTNYVDIVANAMRSYIDEKEFSVILVINEK